MADKETKKYVHPVWGFWDLPIDSSFKQLSDELSQEVGEIVSRKLINTALQKLEPDHYDERDSLYSQMRTGRMDKQEQDHFFSEERRRQKKVKTPGETKDSLETRTAAFHWEISELIKALAKARRSRSGIEGDDLAAAAFNELADTLSAKDIETLLYPDYYALCDIRIRTAMFRRFEPRLKARFLLLWELLSERSPGKMAENMRKTLPAMDNLLVELIEQDCGECFENLPVDVAAVKNLYQMLLKMRKRISVETEQDGRGIDFGRGEIGAVHTALNEVMRKEQHSVDDDERATFQRNYSEYLMGLDEELKKCLSEVNNYAKNYIELRRYIFDDTDAYEAEVWEDLRLFAKDLFDALENQSENLFCYDDYKETSGSAAFLSRRLQNAHNQIRYVVAPQLQVLRILNTLTYFGVTEERVKQYETQLQKEIELSYEVAERLGLSKDESCQAELQKQQERLNKVRETQARFGKLDNTLVAALGQLSTDFLRLPLYQVGKDFDLEAFKDSYNSKAVNVLRCAPLDGERLKYLLQDQNTLKKGELLRYECELVVAQKVEDTVHECIEEVKLMRKRLAPIEEQVAKEWQQKTRRKTVAPV